MVKHCCRFNEPASEGQTQACRNPDCGSLPSWTASQSLLCSEPNRQDWGNNCDTQSEQPPCPKRVEEPQSHSKGCSHDCQPKLLCGREWDEKAKESDACCQGAQTHQQPKPNRATNARQRQRCALLKSLCAPTLASKLTDTPSRHQAVRPSGGTGSGCSRA